MYNSIQGLHSVFAVYPKKLFNFIIKYKYSNPAIQTPNPVLTPTLLDISIHVIKLSMVFAVICNATVNQIGLIFYHYPIFHLQHRQIIHERDALWYKIPPLSACFIWCLVFPWVTFSKFSFPRWVWNFISKNISLKIFPL